MGSVLPGGVLTKTKVQCVSFHSATCPCQPERSHKLVRRKPEQMQTGNTHSGGDCVLRKIHPDYRPVQVHD